MELRFTPKGNLLEKVTFSLKRADDHLTTYTYTLQELTADEPTSAYIDFNQLFKSGYGRTALTVILDRIKNPDDLEGAKRLISWVDKTYISINGKEDSVRGELMIITRNKSKNSLQSIVELYYDLAFN